MNAYDRFCAWVEQQGKDPSPGVVVWFVIEMIIVVATVAWGIGKLL